MNPFASYRAINTKLHAKKRKLLPRRDWGKLASYQSVSQIIDYLKKREGYREVFATCKNNDLHRSDLEVILDRYCVCEIEDMLHYFSGDYKAFFSTFLMQYDIYDMSLILRMITRQEDMSGIEELFVHSEKWAMVDYKKLMSCRNVTQFIEALKGTVYYNALKTLTQEDLVKREFHMEMKLYMLYYNALHEKLKKLKPCDRVKGELYLGTKIDFLNAQWIYRAIKYYDISPEEMLIYCLPNGNKLSYHKLKRIAYVKQVNECQRLIEKYLAYPLFKDNNDAFLDCMSDRYLYKCALKMDSNDETIASSLSFINIMETQMSDLIALTEGVRYALPESELSKYLVHTI